MEMCGNISFLLINCRPRMIALFSIQMKLICRGAIRIIAFENVDRKQRACKMQPCETVLLVSLLFWWRWRQRWWLANGCLHFTNNKMKMYCKQSLCSYCIFILFVAFGSMVVRRHSPVIVAQQVHLNWNTFQSIIKAIDFVFDHDYYKRFGIMHLRAIALFVAIIFPNVNIYHLRRAILLIFGLGLMRKGHSMEALNNTFHWMGEHFCGGT